MNNFEWMRNRIFVRLCNEAYIPPWPQGHTFNDHDGYSTEFIRLSGVSDRFALYMRNRCIVGKCRYGPIKQDPLGILKRLHEKRLQYEATGNLDLLPDVANYAMFEWLSKPNRALLTIAKTYGAEFDYPLHPNAHWPTTNTGDRDDHT